MIRSAPYALLASQWGRSESTVTADYDADYTPSRHTCFIPTYHSQYSTGVGSYGKTAVVKYKRDEYSTGHWDHILVQIAC